jgi:hypothetical protein
MMNMKPTKVVQLKEVAMFLITIRVMRKGCVLTHEALELLMRTGSSPGQAGEACRQGRWSQPTLRERKWR